MGEVVSSGIGPGLVHLSERVDELRRGIGKGAVDPDSDEVAACGLIGEDRVASVPLRVELV